MLYRHGHHRCISPILIEPLEGRLLLAADIRVDGMSFTPAVVAPGDHLTTLGFSLNNVGNAALTSSNYTYDVYLSADRVIDAADTHWFSGTSVLSLNAGGTSRVDLSSADLQQFSVPFNLAPGVYYVGVHVTVAGDGNDSNNWASGGVINIDTAGNYPAAARDLGTLPATGTTTIRECVSTADTDDYFRLALATGRMLNVSLTGAASGTRVCLVGSAGKDLIPRVAGRTHTAVIQASGLPAGTYYVRVARGSADTNYTLSISATATPPRASLLKISSPKLKTATMSFQVAYSDDVMLAGSTIDSSDIVVVDGKKHRFSVKLISRTPAAGDAKKIVATYQMSAPGAAGLWNRTTNGTYTISLAGQQVFNLAGTAALAAKLGTFRVAFATKSRP